MLDGQQGSGIRNARWADPDVYSVKYAYQEGDIWIGRNPHDANYPIGHRDDKHIMVCAGAGSGKGRSFIVNNLALWQGSTVTYDPKGELPDILAPRRGEGDEYCDGMGQDVFVLDPFNRSTVDDRYRGYCDPISMIDPDDSELSNTCYRLANSLVKKKESGQAQDWADKGIAFTALVVEHVVTYREFQPEHRNLHTVYELVLQGNVAQANAATEAFAAFAAERNANLAEGEQPVRPKVFDPYEVLLNDMIGNESASRFLGMEARALMREMERVPKYFTHVSGEAREGLRWLRSSGIERVLSGKGLDESRCFDPRRLKTDPNGVSLFIVLPVEDLKENEPWLQSLFVGIFAAIRAQKIKPKVPILTVLDEFSSLGYQDYIASSLDNIRGAGMKIAFIVQNFGKLKKLYGDEMESFFTNSGLELYFGKIGQIASEYLRKELGETEVVRLARNVNRSESANETTGESIAFGKSTSEGGSETASNTTGQSSTKSTSFGWSEGVNWSDSRNWGQTSGNSMGRNYGPHVFFEGFEHSTNYGTNLSRNSGRSQSDGGNRSKSGQRSRSETVNTSQTLASGSTWNTTTSETRTETTSRTKGYQIGGGIAETFHAKPLLEPHEITSYLSALDETEIDHPAYPGMVLVRIHGEAPFFVRRSNYDQDPFFERGFSADPLHGYLPLSERPLLGYEITPDRILTFQIPQSLRSTNTVALPVGRTHQKVSNGDDLFEIYYNNSKIDVASAFSHGRILKIPSAEEQSSTGAIITVSHLDRHIPIPTGTDLANQFQKVIDAEEERRLQDAAAREKRQAEERARQDKARAELEARRKELQEYWSTFVKKHWKFGLIIAGILALLPFVASFTPSTWSVYQEPKASDWISEYMLSDGTLVIVSEEHTGDPASPDIESYTFASVRGGQHLDTEVISSPTGLPESKYAVTDDFIVVQHYNSNTNESLIRILNTSLDEEATYEYNGTFDSNHLLATQGPSGDLFFRADHERLIWVPADGTRAVLLRYNASGGLFSFPSIYPWDEGLTTAASSGTEVELRRYTNRYQTQESLSVRPGSYLDGDRTLATVSPLEVRAHRHGAIVSIVYRSGEANIVPTKYSSVDADYSVGFVIVFFGHDGSVRELFREENSGFESDIISASVPGESIIFNGWRSYSDRRERFQLVFSSEEITAPQRRLWERDDPMAPICQGYRYHFCYLEIDHEYFVWRSDDWRANLVFGPLLPIYN